MPSQTLIIWLATGSKLQFECTLTLVGAVVSPHLISESKMTSKTGGFLRRLPCSFPNLFKPIFETSTSSVSARFSTLICLLDPGAKVRAYDESMEMFTAAQSDPNMGDLHLDRLGQSSRTVKPVKPC